MTISDKNKYNSTKYRFCVRITNKDIICQVVQPKIIGDHCLCAAYSHELPKYGIEVGLTNYAACYATGLLVARRLLKKLSLDEKYEGCDEPDGEMFLVEHEDGPRPLLRARRGLGAHLDRQPRLRRAQGRRRRRVEHPALG